MGSAPQRFDTIFLGAGPAGSGPLVQAILAGVQGPWLARGQLWADAQAHMGPGSLPQYGIDSDTMARVLLEAVAGAHNPLAHLAQSAIGQRVAGYGDRALPLTVAGQFYAALGEALERIIAQHPPSAFWPDHVAEAIVRGRDNRFTVRFKNGRTARATRVVLALGGYQHAADVLTQEVLPGLTCAGLPEERVALTRDLLAVGGFAPLAARLRALGRAPQVIILGGSHSALCVASLMLAPEQGLPVADGGIRIISRELPKIFYPSVQAAQDDGYRHFTPADVCPVTGRVYRLAGVRMASRTLMQRALGLGGQPQERRLSLQPLATFSAASLRAELQAADCVVPAFGYRPRGLPITTEDGAPLPLSLGDHPSRPRVDGLCRVLDASGQPIANLFGIGLASGYVPRGAVLGGEPSFHGQTNGLWLYQHDLARVLLRSLEAI